MAELWRLSILVVKFAIAGPCDGSIGLGVGVARDLSARIRRGFRLRAHPRQGEFPRAGCSNLEALRDSQSAETVRERVMEEVRRAFRPEFLNRLDEILLFNRLSRAHMTDIVEIQLGRVAKLLADRKIDLEFDGKAMQWLANRGYDPVYGARPLKRVIQRSLQNPLATQILEGKVRDGETVKVGVENGELSVGGQRVMSEAADD